MQIEDFRGSGSGSCFSKIEGRPGQIRGGRATEFQNASCACNANSGCALRRVVHYELRAVHYGLCAAHYGLCVACCALRVACCDLRPRSC